ncbi:head GIN domain-containing protein [Flavitalea flava]
MKNLFFALAAFCTFSISQAQQTIVNDPNAQVREVDDFHAIKVSTGIHLYLSQGKTKAIAVSASEPSFRNRIRTEVKQGVLHIYYDNEGFNWSDMNRKELKVYVSNSLIDGLKASSGAHVDVDGTLKSTNLDMDLSSGAYFTGKVEVGNLTIDQGSGARSLISGTAGHLKASSSSGSSLQGFDLQVDDCTVNASSGGRIEIKVEKEMAVSAHSGGHVNYLGAGVIKEVHTGSGGSVSRR